MSQRHMRYRALKEHHIALASYPGVPRAGRNPWHTLFAHARSFKVDDVVMWDELQFVRHERSSAHLDLTKAPGVQNRRESLTRLPSVARRSPTMPPPLEVTMLHLTLLSLKLVT